MKNGDYRFKGENFMGGRDDLDTLKSLGDVPQSSVGAPCPVILANEGHLSLVYFIQTIDPNWNGETVRILSPSVKGEPVALFSFKRPYAHKFGPPNDEAISGHPLYKKGLRPYSAYEVENSSWIDELVSMNSVHPYHDSRTFTSLRHLIFTFHDSVFECVCEGYSFSQKAGSLIRVITDEAWNLP